MIKGKLRVGKKSGYAILDESGLTVAVIQGKNREAIAAELVRRWNAQEPKCRDASMDKIRCAFCGQDIGWNLSEIMHHQTECILFQNSMGIRPYLPDDPKPDKPTLEVIKIHPDGIPGFFEED